MRKIQLWQHGGFSGRDCRNPFTVCQIQGEKKRPDGANYHRLGRRTDAGIRHHLPITTTDRASRPHTRPSASQTREGARTRGSGWPFFEPHHRFHTDANM